MIDAGLAAISSLADPTRRRIVSLLALGRGEPSRLAAEMCLSRPAASRQLRLLQQAGLIAVRRHYVDRRRRLYFIEPRRLGQIAAWLAGTEVGRAFPETSARRSLPRVEAASNMTSTRSLR